MKLSKILIATMLASTNTGLAQESNIITEFDSLHISKNQKNSIDITLDSALLKKIDRFYAKRNKRKLNQKSTDALELNQQKNFSEQNNPPFNCPGCGRG